MFTIDDLKFLERRCPPIEIPSNAQNVIDTCARIVGNAERISHKKSLEIDIRDGKTISPIEQIFFSAFNTLTKITKLDDQWPVETKLGEEWAGLFFSRQFKIDKYKVDFLICYRDTEMTQNGSSRDVVIECDGHDFHEMSEFERRYEKARDRHMQKKNYKVFRYTGADIVKNHFQIAAEVLSYLVDTPQEHLTHALNLCME